MYSEYCTLYTLPNAFWYSILYCHITLPSLEWYLIEFKRGGLTHYHDKESS